MKLKSLAASLAIAASLAAALCSGFVNPQHGAGAISQSLANPVRSEQSPSASPTPSPSPTPNPSPSPIPSPLPDQPGHAAEMTSPA